MPNNNDQDWNQVTWDLRGQSDKKKTNSQLLNDARRKGHGVTIDKKYGGGGNRQRQSGNLTKLDEETESHKLETVSVELRKLIQKHRIEAGIRSQKELATLCNYKVTVIRAYENGEAVPTPQVLRKIESVIRQKNPNFVPGTLTKARKRK